MLKENHVNIVNRQDISYIEFLLWMNDVVDFCEPNMLDWCQEDNDTYHKLQNKIMEQKTTLILKKLKHAV